MLLILLFYLNQMNRNSSSGSITGSCFELFTNVMESDENCVNYDSQRGIDDFTQVRLFYFCVYFYTINPQQMQLRKSLNRRKPTK